MSYKGHKPQYCPFTIPDNTNLNLLTFVINKVWLYSNPYLNEVAFRLEGYKIQSMLELTTYFFAVAKSYVSYRIEEEGEALFLGYQNHLENNADKILDSEIAINFSTYQKYLLERESFFAEQEENFGEFNYFKLLYSIFFTWPILSADTILDMIEDADAGDSDEIYVAFSKTISFRTKQFLIDLKEFYKTENFYPNAEYERELGTFMQDYKFQYGQLKFDDIAKKLLTSKTINKFLTNVAFLRKPPDYEDIVSTVMNIPYFGLGKRSTIALGSVMLIQVWNEQINKNRHLLNEAQLCLLLRQVVNKCVSMK